MRSAVLIIAALLSACATRPGALRTLPYVTDGDARQVGDLFRPATANGTTVIAIHGGGWSRGDKADLADHVRRLVDRGYSVWAVNYRLAPEFPYPAALEDIRSAHRWLIEHAADHGVPLQRVVVYGYSAGGHLALLHGTTAREHGLRVDAMISGAGPSDLRRYPDSLYTNRFLGAPMTDDPAIYAEASPITHVSPDDPPALLYHGGWDRLVAPAQSIDMVNALAAAGVPARYREIEYGTHLSTFVLEAAALRSVLRFLTDDLPTATQKE